MSLRDDRMTRLVCILLALCLTLPLGSNSPSYATSDQEKPPTNQEERSLSREVKVATYNIAAGIGADGQFDLDRTASVIRESEADIIGLQEVDVHWGSRSHWIDEVQYLAEALEMQAYFAPIYDMDPAESDQPRRQFGLAVLSKYPILEAHNHEITRLSTQEPNPEPKLTPGFLEALVHVDGARVWFYVTHLDYRGDPTVREMQVADMQQIMSNRYNRILVGDLNAKPDASELQPLFDTFTDTWTAAGDGDGFTFPADTPDRRIDYILAESDLGVQAARVEPSQASDHLLVTGTVTLNAASASRMKSLVERLEEEGEFTNDDAVYALKIHLTAVDRFEHDEAIEKIIKHTERFKRLLDHQRKQWWISERAYRILKDEADALLMRYTYVR